MKETTDCASFFACKRTIGSEKVRVKPSFPGLRSSQCSCSDIEHDVFHALEPRVAPFEPVRGTHIMPRRLLPTPKLAVLDVVCNSLKMGF